MPIHVMQLWSGDDPRLRNTLENASHRGGQAANDLTIPQPMVMAAYGLYGPAPAKQIKNEMRQTHTHCNKWPLDLEEASFPVNLSVNAAGVHRLHQPEVSATTDTPRLTLRHSRTSIYMGPS